MSDKPKDKMRLSLLIRDRYHPLFRLRKVAVFQKLTRLLDVPIAIRFPSISHPIYVSLSKNLPLVLSGGAAGEERERQNFIALVKTAGFRRFFDVGANIGLYAFLFRTIVAESEVSMFEPDEDNAGLIRRTLARAGLSDVQLMQVAVSDQEGSVIFYKDELSGATGSIRRVADAFVSVHHGYRPRQVSVRSVTIDSIADTRADPDFIKIDVEGAELNVLHGSEKLLRRAPPAIFLECDENQGNVGSFLARRGYVFFDFASMHKVSQLAHNSLALHSGEHAELLRRIEEGGNHLS
jgi:FkbM family methyltransferase